MYRVTNKNKKTQESELYPAFLVKDMFNNDNKDSKYLIKPYKNGVEVQSKSLWLLIEPWEA